MFLQSGSRYSGGRRQPAAGSLFITLWRPHLLTLTRKECGLLARNPDVHPLPQTHHCLLCLEQGRMRVLAYLCPRIGQGKGIGCQEVQHPSQGAGLGDRGVWGPPQGAGGSPSLSPVLCCNGARRLKPMPLPGRLTPRQIQDPGERRQQPSFLVRCKLISDSFLLHIFHFFNLIT